ncbi:MAG TPA: dienelactone hydrolase family protein [Elusimicrobiota bacterium]|nr:dienelactone hydrolase family protein [Elusimicrobiota bacterium]
MNYSLLSSLMLTSVIAQAALQGRTIEMKDGKTVLEAYVVYDDAVQGKRPAVLVFHDWMGPSAFTRDRADQLAGMGYIALTADIYGKAVRPKDAKEAGAEAAKYKANRAVVRARGQAALNALLAQAQTDPARVAAIGYCFGGMSALELARSGAPLVGVVSFHGSLDTPNPQDAKQIKGKILALHGADDPFVTPDIVTGFEKEMRDAGVDWQLVKYGGAVHAFAVPSAGADNSKGAAYNAKADRRSWQAMKDFFAEIF